MDPSSIGTSVASVRDHLPVFLACLAGLPALSFLMMKFWIAGRATKMQRTTHWFVPTDLESESARMHFGMQNQSVGFINRARISRRTAVVIRKSVSRQRV